MIGARSALGPPDPVDVPPGLPGGDLIGARTGIVRRLERRQVPDHFPRSFGLVAARLADTSTFSPWCADATAAGYGFGDECRRVAAALGEAAERYCGYFVSPGLRMASYAELAVDHAAVDPTSVALFSPQQYRAPGFPFQALTTALPLEWVTGHDVRTGRPVAVPAALVWVTYHETAPAAHVTNPIIQAGLAAGTSVRSAAISGMYEVIERDAMTMCWHGRRGMRRVLVPPPLRALAAGPTGMLNTIFLLFGNEFTVPVIGALVRDRATGYMALGMGSGTDPYRAAEKALGESLQLHLLLGQYDDPDGPIAAAARLATSPLKPWRADRAYHRSYRDDLADAVDYGCHLQLFLDPALQRRFLAELAEVTTGQIALDLVPPTTEAEVLDAVARAGMQVVAVDVTTADVASCDLHVVRTVIPGCYANSAAGLPFLGGVRLARCLADLGARRRDLPLPH